MSGFQYTPENLQRLEKALQTMQERGMESDPQYAQLMSLMRAKPPSAEMSDVGHGLQLPPPSMPMGMGSIPSGTGMGDMQTRSSPAPSMMSSGPPKVHGFSSPQLLQLRAQIMAYKLLACNQPLPEHVRILAIQGKAPSVKLSGAPSQSNQLPSRSQNQPGNQTAPQSHMSTGAGTCSSGAPTAYNVPRMTPDADPFKKGKPSDLELDDLALKIGAEWKRLGIRLGISHDVLEGIAANAEDKPFQMLLRWKNTTSSAAPYHDLYNALCHSRVGLNNLAKEFCCKDFNYMINFVTVQWFDPGQSVGSRQTLNPATYFPAYLKISDSLE